VETAALSCVAAGFAGKHCVLVHFCVSMHPHDKKVGKYGLDNMVCYLSYSIVKAERRRIAAKQHGVQL
jgi:hypothetical protein